MERLNHRLLQWWQAATPSARRTAVGLIVAVVCTGTFFLLTDSPPEPAQTGGLEFGALFYLETMIKLIGVLLLIVGSALVFRRWLQNRAIAGSRGRMAVMETVRMTPRQALHLVRVGDQYFLVGATDQSVGLISVVSPDAVQGDPAGEKAPEGAFQPIFSAMLKADSLQSLFSAQNR